MTKLEHSWKDKWFFSLPKAGRS